MMNIPDYDVKISKRERMKILKEIENKKSDDSII